MHKKQILEFLDAETEIEARSNMFRYTECGAFIEFKDDRIIIGSIVEGSENGTEYFEFEYGKFTANEFLDAIQEIERQASIIWDWANKEDENGLTNAEKGYDWPLL
jgi:hypothetical protein